MNKVSLPLAIRKDKGPTRRQAKTDKSAHNKSLTPFKNNKMPLINCPECSNKVSDSALKCPKCGVQLRKPIRGPFGKFVKWLFIGFNVLMVMWLVSYFMSIGQHTNAAESNAEKAGTVIGATIGTGILVFLWALGDIVLGLFVLFTRPKSA